MDLIKQCKQSIVEEALHVKQDTVFETFARINQYHDQIHRLIIDTVDYQFRKEEYDFPTSYCWIEMGSGGREERTLWTDQDNGIFFNEENLHMGLLQSFSKKVVQSLADGGYPLCNGGVMAINPRWFQSFSGWRYNWSLWAEDLSLDSIRYLLIAWDMRSMYGEESLVHEFKQWALAKIRMGIPRVANHCLHHPLPITIFGRLLTPLHGENVGKYHLKEGGYYQVVSLVRLLSLFAGVIESSTRCRISSLAKLGYLTSSEVKELEEALAFFLFLRLKHHTDLFLQNHPIHDYISLAGCDDRLIVELKQHLKNIKKQQNRWKKVFHIKAPIKGYHTHH